MSEVVPPLYWWVESDGRSPVTMNVGGTKYFLLFSSEINAKAFRNGQNMPADKLNGSDKTSHLLRLVRAARDDLKCDAFVLNPPPNYGGWAQPRSADEMLDLIEFTAGREDELRGWPS